MYDIFCDIWKNPERGFSPMPHYTIACGSDADVITAELSNMHKAGISGVVLVPDASPTDLLSDKQLDVLAEVTAALKKRLMTAVLADGGQIAHGIIATDERLAARRLYALPARTAIPENEELLYRINVRFDEKGRLTDTKLDPTDGYEEYDLVLGYSCDGGRADLLNPYSAEIAISRVLERYSEKLGEYFGSCVIGFSADAIAMRFDEIPWTYGFIEDFFAYGGDIHMLAALFFEPREKKYRREAEFAMRKAVTARIRETYLAPLARFCEEKQIALIGGSHEGDSTLLSCFDVPAAYVSSEELKPDDMLSADAARMKAAADIARHGGLARSLCELELCGEYSPDTLMRYTNFAVARGACLITANKLSLGDTSTRDDMKKYASYVKRMAWLGSAGTNNPVCAVLTTPEYVPHTTVRPLYERGFTFNYLTLSDFMEKASVQDGKILVDRFAYGIILIDSRLRLDAESVTKIGRFVTEGGMMYRGGDFVGFLEKHVKRGSSLKPDADGESIRFTHITKSGVDFFVMINEGPSDVEGKFITDMPHLLSRFDAMTGEITPISGAIADGGFSYPVRIPSHASVVLGVNKEELPKLGEDAGERLCEIAALTDGHMAFDYKDSYRRAVIRFTDACGVDVTVNGEAAGRLIFKPYEIDITAYVRSGENTARISGDYLGCTVRMFE